MAKAPTGTRDALETVLDGIDALVYVADMQTYELLFANSPLREQFGEVVGKTCWQTLQAGQTGPCGFCTNGRLVDEAGRPRGVCGWEFHNTRTGRWYDVRDRAVEWRDGRLVRLEVAFDITERKAAEEERREALERLHGQHAELLRAADAIYWELDLETHRFTHVSESFERLLGYPASTLDDFEGWRRLIHPEDRDAVAARCLDAKTAGEDQSFTHRVVAADGRVVWVRDLVRVLSWRGRPATLQGILIDVTELRAAEAALHEAEGSYRALFDSDLVGVAVEDRQGKLLRSNRVFREMLGYAEAELAGRSEAELSHPEGRARGAELMEEVAEGRRAAFRVEKRLVRKDGGTLWADVAVVGVYGPERRFSHALAVVRDITARRSAEEALKRSEARYRRLFEDAPVSLWECDVSHVEARVAELAGDGVSDLGAYCDQHPEELARCAALVKVRDVNRETLRLFEAPGKEAFIDAVPRVVSGEGLAVLKAAVVALAEGKDAFATEAAYFTLAGRRVPVAVQHTFLPRHGAGARHALVSMEDLTAVKRAEEFADTVFQTVDEGLIVVARDFGIISANRAYCQMAGCNEAEVIGRKCHELSHGSPVPCEERGETCAVRKAYETGRPATAVHEHRDAHERTRFVELKAYPVKDQDGRVASVIETIRDVTEKRRLQEQFLHAQKMEAVGRLAGGVAHDFNNLLTVIVGYSCVLRRQLEPGSPLAGVVAEIVKAGESAATLTRQLLAFSRRQILQPKILDLNAAVQEMNALLRRLIGENIVLSTVLDPDLRRVKADPSQVEQVLANLVVNARDAMPGGGWVTIRTSNVQIDQRYARAHYQARPGPHVLLEVSDTGCGMDQNAREHLFEPFFTTKRTGEGTGLGLSTVYGIVTQSGGHITVDTELGQGTTFRVYLPATTELASIPDGGRAPAGLRGGTETILVVEDEGVVRALVNGLLTECGYRALIASDAVEACRICERHEGTIHLLLSDVVLPGLSGRELAERLLALRPDLRVLFMTGYADDAVFHDFTVRDGAVLIQKPFSPDQLTRKVRSVLDAPAPERRPGRASP